MYNMFVAGLYGAINWMCDMPNHPDDDHHLIASIGT